MAVGRIRSVLVLVLVLILVLFVVREPDVLRVLTLTVGSARVVDAEMVVLAPIKRWRPRPSRVQRGRRAEIALRRTIRLEKLLWTVPIEPVTPVPSIFRAVAVIDRTGPVVRMVRVAIGAPTATARPVAVVRGRGASETVMPVLLGVARGARAGVRDLTIEGSGGVLPRRAKRHGKRGTRRSARRVGRGRGGKTWGRAGHLPFLRWRRLDRTRGGARWRRALRCRSMSRLR